MPVSNLRFVILGDDRASAAFNRFAGNVDKANRAVERNRASLKAAGRDEQSFGQHLRGLSNDVLGFGAAQDAASKKNNLFARGIAAATLATGLLEPQVAALTVAAGGLAAAATAAGLGFIAYGAAARPALQGVMQAIQAQGKVQQAATAAQGTYQAALASAQTRYRLSLGSATTAAQRSSAATALLNARHSALAAKVRATTLASAQYKAQLAGLSPVQRTLARGLVGAQQAYQSWAKQFARPILMPFIRMLSIVHPLLRAFSPVVRQASAAIEILSNQLISAVQGGGLQRWLAAFTPHIAPVIISLGHIIGNLIMGTAGILRAFAPVGQGILGWIEKITAGFARWGQSLPQHGGFQALMEMARKDAPIIRDVLKNIAIAALNVARAMTSMATPANSRALLIALQPVAQLLAQLSRNRVLVQTIAYLFLLNRVVGRLGPAFTAARVGVSGVFKAIDALRGGASQVEGWAAALGRFRDGFMNAAAAESQFSGRAGTLGGKIRQFTSWIGGGVSGIRDWTIWTKIAEGATALYEVTLGRAVLAIRSWTIWSKIAAVATKVWAAVQVAFNAVMDANPIALVVIGIAALIAAVILAYRRFKWFRDFVNTVGRFIAQHWQIMLAVLTGGLSVAVIFIVRHWRQIQNAAGAVFRWVRDHWQILLIALTGPFGAAVVLIISHWNDIRDAARTVINWVRNAWGAMTGALQHAWRVFVDFFLSLIGSILHGAATAFGWIPGLGSRLRSASAAFDRFRDRVNSSLKGINGRTVKVNVDFGGGTFGGPKGSSSGGVGSGGFRARGGLIRGPGGPEDDRAGLYALSDNEYVIRARAHRKYGTRFLDAINAGKLEDGEPAYPHRQRRAPGLLAAGGQPEPGLNVRTRFPASAEINSALIGPVRYLARQWARNQMFGGLFTTAVGRAILQYASRFAGHVPYVWGGQTPSGWDCCLIYDMRVQTNRGPKQIGEIEPGDLIYSWNDGKLATSRVLRRSAPRRQQTYRLRTLHREIIASGNHPFLVLRDAGPGRRPVQADQQCTIAGCDLPAHSRGACGNHYREYWRKGRLAELAAAMPPAGRPGNKWRTEWVELEKLRRGDIVVMLKNLPDDAPRPDDPYLSDQRFLWLLGLAFGDGSLAAQRPNRVYLCVFGDLRAQVQDRLNDYCGKRGIEHPKHGLYLHHAGLAAGLHRFGLSEAGVPTRSTERQVPRELWALPHALIQAFLDGYTAADGSRSAGSRGDDQHIRYTAANERLIRDIQNLHMVLGHGVGCVKEIKRTRPVIIKGKEVKQPRSLWSFETRETGRKLDGLAAGLLASPELAAIFPADSNFAPQKITAIDQMTVEDTYDITVEDTHNFVAEGLVVHNSGFVSYVYEKFRLLGSRMVSQTLQQWATPSGPVPGGMVFFGRPAYHVGFVAGRGQMLSALGRQFGTIFSSMSGNSGYGVPPRGFGQLNFSGPAGAGGGPNFWRAVGREMAARYGWTGSEWVALDRLWNRESGWNANARNPFSRAAGIPQDITGNMHGGGRGQIGWGLNYIRSRYGDPLRAWAHEMAVGWYDRGGSLPPGISLAVNNTGRHERVVAPGQERPEVTVNVGPVAVTEAADVDLLARRLGFGIASAGFG